MIVSTELIRLAPDGLRKQAIFTAYPGWGMISTISIMPKKARKPSYVLLSAGQQCLPDLKKNPSIG
jgi:hypothetical protein